ncbi:MAG: V-type ATP synthase subunit E [Methanomicrobiales archaeon]|nr:V-type ATP synthase subunit E [Methanomicrobiales archaeon]
MGIETVLEEIREKGRKEVEETRKDTQGQVEGILSQGQERVKELERGMEDELAKQVGHILSQEVSAANLSAKRLHLTVQKELFEQVKEKTLSSILAKPEGFHRGALERLLLKAAKEIREGSISANERQLPLVKEILGKRPEFSGLRPGEPAAIEGGIIAESRDGRLKIEYSYRSILDKVWAERLKEVSDVLFR